MDHDFIFFVADVKQLLKLTAFVCESMNNSISSW